MTLIRVQQTKISSLFGIVADYLHKSNTDKHPDFIPQCSTDTVIEGQLFLGPVFMPCRKPIRGVIDQPMD